MSDPAALDVLEALQVRLQTILVTGGFNTNAGNQVYLGKRQVNPDKLDIGPVINVYDTDDEPDEETVWGDEPIRSTLSINVDAFVRDSDVATRAAHLLTQDIFNAALDITDRTVSGVTLDLGYAGRAIEYPPPGGDTVSVTIVFTSLIELPYGNI